jgi:tRNA pseudouridine55 synthase
LINGVLVVDKPESMTSFSVVSRVRRLLGLRKAGHTGTLDPIATGVLPICLESATRLAGLLLEGDKTYEATLKLGAATDTQDRTGKIVAEAEVPPHAAEEVGPVLARFIGEIEQAPPMFSAVKVAGKRLYQLARQGKEIHREARRVVVHGIDLLAMELPRVRLRICCSKGTYIRTLAHEIGETLGCHAHLEALRRTASGGFSLDEAIRLDELAQLSPEQVRARVLTPRQALGFLPEVIAGPELAGRIAHGQPLGPDRLAPPPEGMEACRRLRLVSEAGVLLAVVQWSAGKWKYLCVLGV